MFRNIGSFSCFTSMCVSQISWATAVWGHYCGTCAPRLVWHMRVRDNSSQSGWCAWRADRGSCQVASNQAARGREPSTFPKHEPPCIPEPP